MAKIFRSDLRVGNFTYVENDPAILYLENYVYCPSGTPNCVPAVYDFGRKLVSQSFYSRGPIPAEVFPTCSMPFEYEAVQDYADDQFYIYLGEVHNHFGHFLLSTLSRIWHNKSLSTSHKIIINAGAAERVRKEHIRRLFEAFGIDVERLVTFERPTKIRNLVLPCPSFEERNFVHAAFGEAFRKAGDHLLEGLDFDVPGNGPIYLSKTMMMAGVRKITNELLVEERLRQEGFSIVHPETLPITEQVALWRLNRPVVAFSGSSLHTSAFSSDVRMVCLGWDRFVDTSFSLCDRACGNSSDYFYFEPGTFIDHGPSPDHFHGIVGLSSRIEAADPVGVAEGILRAVEVSLSRPGNNLARDMPTTQSSRFVEGCYDSSKLSATSGRLTGCYQFCTLEEQDPWWQVDLGEDCVIEEIVVYNRTDAGTDRSNDLRITLSPDGRDFDLLAAREGNASFGGLNGGPWRASFDPPRYGRFVRVSIPGSEFLHLDQVEVYGRRLAVDTN